MSALALARVVDAIVALKRTRSRKKKAATLAELFATLDTDDLERTVFWLIGELPPGKIGVGPSAAWSALKATEAAESSSLACDDTHARFDAIASIAGKGSKQRRADALQGLFSEATEAERHFLAGLLTGELRQGALAGVVTEGLAAAFDIEAPVVRRAAMLAGSLPEAAVAARVGGEAALRAFRMRLFTPLQPMLASPCEGPEQAVHSLGTAVFDHKLDGARIQVHRDGDHVEVYTRALHKTTRVVPEVVELARSLPAKRFILDGEVLALRSDGRPHVFQTTMRRFGRTKKDELAQLAAELPLTPMFFDALLVGEEELIDRPLNERLDVLDALVPAAHRIPRVETSDPSVASAFYEVAVDAGNEGVMAKDPASPYAAGSRGRAWLKIKPTHTLDLVVIAVDWGSGRRSGWLSNIHLAAYDPENDAFVMLGKTFKGMTDEILRWQTRELLARETHRDDYTVHVRPELVVEIAFNDVQQSPRYPGGLALRFARVKQYRPDKKPEQADTIDAVRQIHTTATL